MYGCDVMKPSRLIIRYPQADFWRIIQRLHIRQYLHQPHVAEHHF